MNNTNPKRNRYGVAAATVAALILSAPYAAHATNYTWNGETGDGQWTRAANWAPMGVPGAQDTATIGGSAAVQVPGGITLRNLRLGADATILNDGVLNVTGWTSSDGVVEGLGELNIPDGAAATLNLSATLFARNSAGPMLEGAWCKPNGKSRRKGKKDEKVEFGKVKNKGKLKINVDASVDVEFDNVINDGGDTVLELSGAASNAPIMLKKLKNEKGTFKMLGTGAGGRAFESEKVSNNDTMVFDGATMLSKDDFSNEKGAKIKLRNGSLLGCSDIAKKLENQGLVELINGDAEIAMEWRNKGGHLRVGTGTLTIAPPAGKTVTQESGTTTIDGGTLEIIDSTKKASDKGLLIQGGVLDGSGTIEGDVTIDGGAINVGHSPGLMTINGNFSMTANGLMQMEIWGPTPGYQYDQLRVNGNVYFAGTLNIEYGNNYLPGQNIFAHIYYATYFGKFSKVNFINPIGNKHYLLAYGPSMLYSRVFDSPNPLTQPSIPSAPAS